MIRDDPARRALLQDGTGKPERDPAGQLCRGETARGFRFAALAGAR
jgi:hypothetical protein